MRHAVFFALLAGLLGGGKFAQVLDLLEEHGLLEGGAVAVLAFVMWWIHHLYEANRRAHEKRAEERGEEVGRIMEANERLVEENAEYRRQLLKMADRIGQPEDKQ